MNGPEDVFLTGTKLLSALLTDVHIKILEKEIYDELDTENPFLLGLSEVELEDWFDSKLLIRFNLTVHQVETLEEENLQKTSYLFKLPKFCIENIVAYLQDDMAIQLQSIFDKWQRLKKIRSQRSKLNELVE